MITAGLHRPRCAHSQATTRKADLYQSLRAELLLVQAGDHQHVNSLSASSSADNMAV